MSKKRGNGEGTVWHNKERGRWEAQFVVDTTADGRPIRKRVTAKTRSDVLKRMRDAQAAAASGETRARADLTVGRFLDNWVADVLPGSVAPTTLQQYKDVVRLYIKPKLGRKKLVTLNAREVSRMVQDLAAEGKAPNTQRLARSILRRALRFAEHEGLVARNAAAISFGVKVPKPEGRSMTIDQAKQFMKSIQGHRMLAAWLTMLTLGLRRGELLGLAWSDLKLDSDRPTLTVRRALKRLPQVGLYLSEPKNKSSTRAVHLPGITVSALRRHRAAQRLEQIHAGPEWVALPLGHDLVFRTPTGTAQDPDNFRNLTYRATEGAGIGKWSPHELRHSAASLLFALDVPMKTVSETLGHTSIRITADIYAHLMEDARAEAASAMDRAFGI